MVFFFFNDTATTEIYTLSLHDALPISWKTASPPAVSWAPRSSRNRPRAATDRKSTRLNSSHQIISYAVFCLKKKKQPHPLPPPAPSVPPLRRHAQVPASDAAARHRAPP